MEVRDETSEQAKIGKKELLEEEGKGKEDSNDKAEHEEEAKKIASQMWQPLPEGQLKHNKLTGQNS